MSEINSKKYDNKRYKTKIYLEQSKKYIDVIEDYLSFINDVENDKYTPNELIESLVSKLNRFIMGREDKNLIYEELKFDLVDSFGYDDGDSDILPTHFGFWSNEYQLGYIEIIKVKEHFERVYEHFDNLSELKSSLNSMKVNLKSPF